MNLGIMSKKQLEHVQRELVLTMDIAGEDQQMSPFVAKRIIQLLAHIDGMQKLVDLKVLQKQFSDKK